MAECYPILKITDGTTQIDLLSRRYGFHLSDWTPAITEPKDGGTFTESIFGEGRRLTSRVDSNVIETMEIKLNADSQDSVILNTQNLRRLLTKAHQYWTTEWQNEPVWIEARAADETNMRYAIIVDWRFSKDDNPYMQPFFTQRTPGMDNLTLILERMAWTEHAPGDEVCVETSSLKYPFSSYGQEQSSPVSDTNDGAYANVTDEIIARGNTAHPKFGLDTDRFDAILRVINVQVPKGAHIIDAKIYFTPQESDTGDDCNAIIYGELEPVPGGIERYYSDYLFATRTESEVYWTNIGHWTAGSPEYTPSIKAIVQELVDQDGWAIGGDMKFFITDYGSDVGAHRVIGGFNGSAYAKPELNIFFVTESDTAVGRVATCLDEVYLTNHHGVEQINYMYFYDDSAGTYSPNMIGMATPFFMCQSNIGVTVFPAANDRWYFGFGNIGGGLTAERIITPFSNLIFDLLTNAADLTELEYGYYSTSAGGSWQPLNVIDRTQYFDQLGVNSISWIKNKTWTPTLVNGKMGYWFYIEVISVGGGIAVPQQQNRDVYTESSPYIDIDSAQIPGDIAALARTKISLHATDYNADANIIFATRSLSRGERFTPYLVASDYHTQYGIGAEANINTTFVNDYSDSDLTTASPAGRSAKLTATSAQGGVTWKISPLISGEYVGNYAAFARVKQISGVDGEYIMRLRVNGFGTRDYYTDYTMIGTTKTEYYMGRISLMPNSKSGEVPAESEIELEVKLFDVYDSAIIFIFDLILIPIDEFFYNFKVSNTDPVTVQSYFDLDNINYPKRGTRVLIRNQNNDKITGNAIQLGNTPWAFQPNSSQRVWMFATETNHEWLGSIQNFRSARYYSMRGGR